MPAATSSASSRIPAVIRTFVALRSLSNAKWSPLGRSPKYRRGSVRRITLDRKSTRLNSSHLGISYAVFCLKKKRDFLRVFPVQVVVGGWHQIGVVLLLGTVLLLTVC